MKRNMTRRAHPWHPALLVLGLLAGLTVLQGCVPVVATGVVVGALAANDRRSLGTQTEDESIGWKVGNRLSERFGSRIHVNATCYNRKLVLTGELPEEAMRAEVLAVARRTENVQAVWDEMVVAPISSVGARTADTYVTSKVRARFLDSGQFSANHVKAFTEAKVVYLLGMLTNREASAAIEVARTTAGVTKVVSLLEIISDTEARRLDNQGMRTQSSSPSSTRPAGSGADTTP